MNPAPPIMLHRCPCSTSRFSSFGRWRDKASECLKRSHSINGCPLGSEFPSTAEWNGVYCRASFWDANRSSPSAEEKKRDTILFRGPVLARQGA